MPSLPASPVGIVLAGGAARGAYEVGVVAYVLDEVARALGRPIPIDIVCGTSVGAINACMLAASADDPSAGAALLVETWKGLRMEKLVRPNRVELTDLVRSVLTLRRRAPTAKDTRRGGVVDPTGIERLVEDTIPFGRIRDHLKSGRLVALSVSTTEVATGKTVIFVERAEGGIPRWSRDPTIVVRATEIRAEHALASAAVPFFFPAVRIGDDFYCDGGLRQNVPLSPARRLGAESLLVINPRYVGPVTRRAAEENEKQFPSLLFLLGKALNALLLDRIDNDIARLRRINDILEAGIARFGPDFVDQLNVELSAGRRLSALRPLDVVQVRASADIGRTASEYVESPEFAARAPAVVGALLRRVGEWEGEGEGDLLSYLLFDGEFAARLIELGRNDAARQHDALCKLYEARVTGR